MKNWKKLISAGLALGLVLTNVPQNTSVVYAQENGTLQNITFEQEQEAVQNAPITVQKVNGLSKDFVNGVDVSSYLSLVESGAKYYDEKGDEADLFDLLENAGVNYVRLCVWIIHKTILLHTIDADACLRYRCCLVFSGSVCSNIFVIAILIPWKWIVPDTKPHIIDSCIF